MSSSVYLFVIYNLSKNVVDAAIFLLLNKTLLVLIKVRFLVHLTTKQTGVEFWLLSAQTTVRGEVEHAWLLIPAAFKAAALLSSNVFWATICNFDAFFIYLFIQQTDWKHFVWSVLMWCWNDTKLLVFPIGSSGFSHCKDKNVDFADFIDLIYSIIYIIYHFTGGLEVKVRFWNCLTLSSTHTHTLWHQFKGTETLLVFSCAVFSPNGRPQCPQAKWSVNSIEQLVPDLGACFLLPDESQLLICFVLRVDLWLRL